MATPARRSPAPRIQAAGLRKLSENVDPNLLISISRQKPPYKSPAANPDKRIELTPKNSAFVTPKKKSFLTPRKPLEPKKCPEEGERRRNAERSTDLDVEEKGSEGSSKANAMSRLILEEAISSLPAYGAGRVMYLVKTFESLLSIHREAEWGRGGREDTIKVKDWALPGMDFRPKVKASAFFRSSVSCSEECLTRDYPEGGSAEDKSNGSSRRSRNKRLIVKSPLPFKLRTEQRGRYKEEQFIKKVKEIFIEEEKQHIPTAQELPRITKEPEFAKRISFLHQIKRERERVLKKRSSKAQTILEEQRFHIQSLKE